MSTIAAQKVSVDKIKVTEKSSRTWWLLFRRELADLWIGGKAFNLLLIYSILLAIITYSYSLSAELSLVPPQEAVYEMLKNVTVFSIFIGLVIGADSISGERDRSTLESLLLTPVNRRHIITAKLLAGISPWPAAYLISIPFLYVLAQGNEVLGTAIVWGAVTGTALVLGYTGMGMLISFWAGSNKISYFVSLSIFALLLVPVELSEDGADITGVLLQWTNPISAVNYFLSKYLVEQRSLSNYWPSLVSVGLLPIGTLTLLLKFAGSRLHLEPGLRSTIRAQLRRVWGLSLFAGLLVVSLSVSPANAFPTEPANQTEVNGLNISIDREFQSVKMGDRVSFSTVVSNDGLQSSPPLIVAMNIINLETMGDVVDYEDWFPQRTQHIDSLAPDEAIDLNWIIKSGLHGDYIVYIVLIPQPSSIENSTNPVASSSMHLRVIPFTRLHPRDVLPSALGVPLILLAITFVVYRRRRQQIDMGGSS